jgi:hypothetical protein
MNDPFQQLSLTLLSGLMGSVIGAVVGGYYSYKGATDAAKTQIDHLYQQEKEKRKYEKKREEEIMLNSFLSEAKENLDLGTKWQTSYSKSILSTETWSIYKGRITSLPTQIQEKLIKSYTEIKRYNALAEYDRAKVAVGHGTIDQAIQQQAGVVVSTITPLVEELGNHLKVVPPVQVKQKVRSTA